MYNFNFDNTDDVNDFVDLLFRYVSVLGDAQRIKAKIGIASARRLHDFLTSFVERNEESIIAFAKIYFEGAESI